MAAKKAIVNEIVKTSEYQINCPDSANENLENRSGSW